MNKHPKLKINLTRNELFTEFATFLLLVFFWIISISSLDYLPDEIPTHYNGLGEVDAYGDKEAIYCVNHLISVYLYLKNQGYESV